MFWDYRIAASYLWLGFLSNDWAFKKELMAAELFSLDEMERLLLFEFLIVAIFFLTIVWVSLAVEIGSLNEAGSENNSLDYPGNLVENFCPF